MKNQIKTQKLDPIDFSGYQSYIVLAGNRQLEYQDEYSPWSIHFIIYWETM